MNRVKLGITMGDPAGVGAEIIIKALADKEVYASCVPIIYGDLYPLKNAISFCNSPFSINVIKDASEAIGEYGVLDLIDFGLLSQSDWEYGKVQARCGDAAFKYITSVIRDALDERIDGTVTAPINKEALNSAGYNFDGHTEIYAHFTKTEKYSMLLASGNLRVVHVSTHCSLREACDRVKKERVIETIELADKACKMLGISKPRIAVAGINPHNGENGLFGTEEIVEIIPAIQSARNAGFDVSGPIAPDTVFTKVLGSTYDIAVAMYHDQGHIPLKLNGFVIDKDTGLYSDMRGINATIGLPIVRVSVDHGTAFGKAGKGIADSGSMLDAISTAIDMSKKR